MTRTRRVGLLVALGLLAATAGTTSAPAQPTTRGPVVEPASETALAVETVDGAEVGGAQPDIAFNGESGTLAGVSESAGASAATAAAKSGSRGLQLSSAAAPAYARWNSTAVPQGHAYSSLQVWVRVLSRAAGESVDLVTVGNTLGTAHFDFFVNGNTQRFQWDLFRDDTADMDVPIVYNRWYLVELQVEFAGTEHTAQVRIDGIRQESIQSAGTASTVKMLTVGSSAAKTHVQHYDDLELRVGDVPLGWPAHTPPQVALTQPVEGAVFGDDDVVTADFACTRTDHTLASCVGTTADGGAVDTAVPGNHSYTVTATDVAGYTASTTTHYQVVDDDVPTIAVVSPQNGLVVARGADLAADFSCDDPGGALAPADGCVGSADPGLALDTDTVGAHPFTVTATDAAGNHATWNGTYTVVANRPDADIRSNLRSNFGGDDVYSQTGAGQTTQTTVGRRSAVTFLVRIENDATATDTIEVRGVRARPGWRVRYYDGSREISAAIHAGTYELRDLGPGRSHTVRIVVQPRAAATGRQDVTLTASAGHARDTVRAIVRRRA